MIPIALLIPCIVIANTFTAEGFCKFIKDNSLYLQKEFKSQIISGTYPKNKCSIIKTEGKKITVKCDP
jgi:hypothetical protein